MTRFIQASSFEFIFAANLVQKSLIVIFEKNFELFCKQAEGVGKQTKVWA